MGREGTKEGVEAVVAVLGQAAELGLLSFGLVVPRRDEGHRGVGAEQEGGRGAGAWVRGGGRRQGC